MRNEYVQVSLQEYLEAKISVDARSINRDVEEACGSRLRNLERVDVLDVGCGTGAGLMRLVERVPNTKLIDYTGLDQNPRNMQLANDATRQRLSEAGFRQVGGDSTADGIDASTVRVADSKLEIQFRFVTGDIFAPIEQISRQYDLVLAHTLLDLLPLSVAVDALGSRVGRGGMLYCAFNYDGVTSLFPQPRRKDELKLESLLLANYHRSMNDRRVNGIAPGGSRTGSSVYEAFQTSFDVVAYGPSDWSVFSFDPGYGADQRLFLNAIVGMIAAEGTRNQGIDSKRLSDWFDFRIDQISNDKFGLIVHQTDILGTLR